MKGPHGEPTAEQLLESVREWIERDLVGRLEGKAKFDARVASNILAMVVREMEAGDEHAVRHEAALAALGALDDAELVERIRLGAFDGDLGRVVAVLRPVVEDRVAVANPDYLGRS